MPNLTLRVNVNINPNGTLTNTLDYAEATENLQFNPIATLLSNGSGVSQANTWATLASTVAASGNWDIDLTNLDNVFGAVNLSKVKIFLLHLDSPNGQLYVTVGSGATNGWNLISEGREEVWSTYYHENVYNGWTVDGSHKTVRVTNPTASAVALTGWIVGVE